MKGLKLLQKARDLVVLNEDIPGRSSLFFMLLSAAIDVYYSSEYNLVREMDRIITQYSKMTREDERVSSAYAYFRLTER
jgi:hypothetical protein